jgi:hypothetical protein
MESRPVGNTILSHMSPVVGRHVPGKRVASPDGLRFYQQLVTTGMIRDHYHRFHRGPRDHPRQGSWGLLAPTRPWAC